MAHAAKKSKKSDDNALCQLRRRARYLTGSTEIGNAIAAAAHQIMSGELPRQHPEEPLSVQLTRALYKLYPELSETMDLLACSAQTLEVIEQYTRMQIADILDLDHGDETQLAGLRQRKLPLKNVRVLLIEDEALLAMDLCDVISELGNLIVGVARTRAEAVEAAIRVKPDIIVSDLALADGSSGTDAVSSIETRHRKIPVVILTGTAEAVLTDRASDPVYVLEKPHEPEQLQLMMALALRPDTALPSLGGARPGEKPDQQTDQRQ